MKLIVGLGNPGSKYRGNRHNIGFMVVDRIAETIGAPSFKEKWKGEWTRGQHGGEEIVLLKPMTFMNLSGESVSPAMAFFKVTLADIVVIHDELDIPFGRLQIKAGGGAAGHNGLKSIIQHCGPDYARVRFGIGRPTQQAVESYVLGDFSSIERSELPSLMDIARDAALAVGALGVGRAMNKFNTVPKKVD